MEKRMDDKLGDYVQPELSPQDVDRLWVGIQERQTPRSWLSRRWGALAAILTLALGGAVLSSLRSSGGALDGTGPRCETRPAVGLWPDIRQFAAGCRIDPPGSDPTSRKERPADSAAAAPADEPPATRSRFQGFKVWP